MYHATNQTVEYKQTGREAQRALVRDLSNLKYGAALLKKGLLYSLYHNSNDCQARGVNKAYEPIYRTHFLRSSCVLKVHVQKCF